MQLLTSRTLAAAKENISWRRSLPTCSRTICGDRSRVNSQGRG